MSTTWWTKERINELKELFKTVSTVEDGLEKASRKYQKNITSDSFRSALRRNGEVGELENLVSPDSKNKIPKDDIPDIDSFISLINRSKHKSTLVSFRKVCNKLDISPKKAETLIKKARELGYAVEVENDSLYIKKEKKVQDSIPKIKIKKDKSKRFKFGVISDTHAGSAAALPEVVKDFVNYAYKDHGVRLMLHGGDILTGNSVYRGQIAELDMWGCKQQCEGASEMLPQLDDLKYYAILGNHDVNFVKSAGVDPGYILNSMRPDIIILGSIKATFEIAPYGLMVELAHIKSSAHAKSYALEKHIAKNISKGTSVDMIFAGHRHTAGYWMLNDIHSFMCPCFENANFFVKYNDFVPSVGGIIVDVELNSEGRITKCVPEFRMYDVEKDTHIVIQ